MIINLLDKDLKIYKSFILLYNTYADEKFSEAIESMNKTNDIKKLIPIVSNGYDYIFNLIEKYNIDIGKAKFISNINPYNCSILDLKKYIHYISEEEKYNLPQQFLFGECDTDKTNVNPIGTTSLLKYDLEKITEQFSDNFENYSTDLYIVTKDIKCVNCISFDDFFTRSELHTSKKYQYGNIKLFFPYIYNILITYLTDEKYKKVYPHLFVNSSITKYMIDNNTEFFSYSAGKKLPEISSQLSTANVLVPIVGTQQKVVNCRNIFDLIPLTQTKKSGILFVKLILKNSGRYYSVVREKTDIESRVKKIDDKEAKQFLNRYNVNEMVQIRIEKQNYNYSVYIDEKGCFMFNFYFLDSIPFTFELLDVVVKEEYDYVLGLMTELMSTYLVSEKKMLMKNFSYSIKNSMVEFSLEDSDVSIESFKNALDYASVETDIIGFELGSFYIKKGLSTQLQQLPYSNIINTFEYELRLSEIRRQNTINISYLNHLTISISNVNGVDEEKYIKHLFSIITTRTTKEVFIASGSNIKKLRSADPKTFKPPGDFVYSKGCQKKHQPVYVDSTIYALLTEEEKKRIVEIKNHTTGKLSSYYCPSKEFPNPNFIHGHPDNYCTPCCQVKAEKQEILDGCKATGILGSESRKSKKSSSYSYLPTAGNSVERTRTYILQDFTDVFDLYGIALDRKVNNFLLPSFDAAMLYYDKSPEELIKRKEVPNELEVAFSPGTLPDFNVSLTEHVDTMWTRLGVTPIYINAAGSDISIKTVPTSNEKYIIIYKSAPVKVKKNLTEKAQAKLKAKELSAGGAVGENYFVVTKSGLPYFTNQADCTFTEDDYIIKYIFSGKKKTGSFSLADLDDGDIKYQVVDNQDKTIGVVTDGNKYISVTKSFPSTKIKKILAGDGSSVDYEDYDAIAKLLEKLNFSWKNIVHEDKIIGFRVGDLDIFCENAPEASTVTSIVNVNYNSKEFFRYVLWGTKKVTIMSLYDDSIYERSKDALYRKYTYSIVLLQIAENYRDPLPTTLEETKAMLEKLVSYVKKPKGFSVGNMIQACNKGVDYCDDGKVIVDERYEDELSKLIFYDITKNNVINYIRANINNFKIINKFRFTKRVNEKITFYVME